MPSMQRSTSIQPLVGLASNTTVRDDYIDLEDLARLESFAAFRYEPFDQPSSWDEAPPDEPKVLEEFVRFAEDLDALIVCHGAPRVSGTVLEGCPDLRFVGELEGDRFARRIDVDAARERGVCVVDTTQGSSYPVSEWALAMILIGLRNAGSLYRKLISHERVFESGERYGHPSYLKGELTGRTVGLIGCGHIGRRLLEFLRPFGVQVFVYDPYVPRELADVYDLTLTSLDNALSIPDVVVCLAPLTPRTKGMIGAREIGLIRSGAVFVNVSRGAIVDSEALVERVRTGDLIASLDVFDPEPIPVDSPIRDLPNVFITPHIAGVTRASRTRFFSLMVDELYRFFHGHETRYDLLPRTLADRRGEATHER